MDQSFFKKKKIFSDSFKINAAIEPSLFTVNKLTNCFLCKSTYENPIILPCGKKVCKKDLSELGSKQNSISCPFCLEQHIIPNKGFPSDDTLDNLIKLRFNELNFETMLPRYKKIPSKNNIVPNYLTKIV